jgi:hypothetical protein
MKYILYLLCLACVAGGCNSTVSRSQAEEIITAAYHLPIQEIREFYSVRIKVSSIVPYSNTDQWISRLGEGELYLVQQGIRSAEIIDESMVDGFVPEYRKVINLGFTKGNPVNVPNYTQDNNGINHYNIPVATYSFGGITSLRKITDGEYEVEFSITLTPNEPYFEAYKRGICTPAGLPSPIPFMHPDKLRNIKQRILKYDNGWSVAVDEKEALMKKLIMPSAY